MELNSWAHLRDDDEEVDIIITAENKIKMIQKVLQEIQGITQVLAIKKKHQN
jgi:hypothetical protein